jgi:hypothetical protein
MTAMSAALEGVGYSRRATEFNVALVKFFASGGTIEECRRLVESAAARMPSGGHMNPAQERRGDDAPARQPQTNGTGHDPHAQPRHVASARPVRDRRAAHGAVGFMLAKTVLDTCKTHDGRPWGDVGAHELDSLSRDGALAKAIQNKIGPLSNSQRFKTIRELLSAEQFDAARKSARE